MKKLLLILLVLSLLLSATTAAFAVSLSDMDAESFAQVTYNGGTAASYPDQGVILFEKDGEISVLVGELDTPTGLAVDDNGNLYYSETGNNRICKLIKGASNASTYKSGLAEPTGLCWKNSKLYVAETGKNRIISISNGTVTNVAGIVTSTEDSNEYEGAYVDGSVAKAQFDHPQAVFVNDNGDIYISDTNNHSIRLIQDGLVYSIWTNNDLENELIKPGDLWVKDNTIYVRDLFCKKTLSKVIVENKYTDVDETHWAYKSIIEATKRNLVAGMTDTLFEPGGSLTRAQFVQMLAGTYCISDGNAVIDGDSTFDDVKDTDWYADVLEWAGDNGIIETTASFQPNEAITRNDMFVMLYKLAAMTGKKDAASADLKAFTDYSDIPSDSMAALSWMVAKGVVAGYPDNTLGLERGASRAEAVTILLSYLNL